MNTIYQSDSAHAENDIKESNIQWLSSLNKKSDEETDIRAQPHMNR